MGQIQLENLSIELQNKINSGGSGGGASLPISANDITENPNKVFVSSTQRAMIDSNSQENASQTTRISNIEGRLNSIISTDELVKMDSVSQAMYLSDLIDNLTIKNKGGKLVVEALDGLLATVSELNSLQGISSNIQQQINNLSGVSSFRGVYNSLVELQAVTDPVAGQYAIVSDGVTSAYYFYYQNNWDFANETMGVSTLDINNNTTGTLSKSRYEKQNASDTSFLDNSNNISANNVNDAILEVFRFADSLLKELTQTVGSPLSSTDSIEISLQKLKTWWASLANAISNKGISTSPSNNGDDMIQKIGAIPNISIEGTIRRVAKLNITAPYTLPIVLNNSLRLEDICVTLFEYVPGATGVVIYDIKFNNADSTSFEVNEYVLFDGVAKLKKEYIRPIESIASWSGEGYMNKIVFDRNNFKSIEGFSFN